MSDLPRYWDQMSVPQLWERLNDRRRGEAAASTVAAVAYALRAGGFTKLSDPACKQRLAEMSDRQLQELIEGLARIQSKYPAVTDELLRQLKALI